jgi:hypothetical protein
VSANLVIYGCCEVLIFVIAVRLCQFSFRFSIDVSHTVLCLSYFGSFASFCNDANSIKWGLGVVFKCLVFCTIPLVPWLLIPSERLIVLMYEENINESSTQK